MSGSKPLTAIEKTDAFRRATSGFARCYAEQLAGGMTDADLARALKDYLGIFGGSGGPNQIDISFQGAGLKIWASHKVHNHVLEKPILQGQATVDMARHIYKISDPTDMQLSLI